jgi:hypothetical protein
MINYKELIMRGHMVNENDSESYRLSDWPEHKTRPNKYGNLILRGLNLISLEGCDDNIPGSVDVSTNKLGNLVGGPSTVGNDYIANACQLVSLDGIPSKIGGGLDLSQNPLTSLQGINKLKEMHGWIELCKSDITSHILGVFFIKGCQGIDTYADGNFKEATKIVNRHIEKGRAGLLPCQKELIEAGLADFAQI